MKKNKEFKFNIYFNKDGERIETIIVDSILCYLKNNRDGMIF